MRRSKIYMIWIILLSTLVCIGIIMLLVMYTEAMRDTVLEHTLIFEEFPKSFQKVNVFLYLIFIEGSFRIR